MPTNVTYEYSVSEQEYHKAQTLDQKLKALKKMLATVPKHKGTEKLQKEIKEKIRKLKYKKEKAAKQKKTGFSLSVKKEGAAQVVLVGTTNSGKSTLLKELTGAKVDIAEYPFTTIKPEVGMMDIDGIKIQIVEIPAIIKDFEDTEMGPTFLGIIRTADLMVWLYNSTEEKKLLKKELADVNIPKIDYRKNPEPKQLIWKSLGIIKVFTKEPGKKPSFPPIALKKDSTIKNMAQKVHKDFIKRFRYAKIWGKSARFPGQQVGINHKLEDGDIVQLHMK
jgi:ribosome-interacting GTPase 1